MRRAGQAQLTALRRRFCGQAKDDVENLYSILGLQKGASPDEIKAAYHRLAKESHPDSLGRASAERFQEINHAYNTLLHVGLRRMYDLQLRRREAQERCERLERQVPFLTRLMSGPLGPMLMGACAALGAGSALVLGTMGAQAFMQSSEGFFWSTFRCYGQGHLEPDSSDWARQLLAAQHAPELQASSHASQLAALHARRSKLAASSAREAARQAVSLSQRAAAWLRPGHAGEAWAQRHADAADAAHGLGARLRTVAAESADFSAAHRALRAAQGAEQAMRRAKMAVSMPKDEAGVPKEPPSTEPPSTESQTASSSTSPQAAAASTAAPTLSPKEEDMYKGERMAAQTAGLCVLTICIVLVWFQSNAVDPAYHRKKNREGEEDSILARMGVLCCCCRRIACCASCLVQFIKLLASCNCATLSVMGLVVFLLGYGFKQLWDNHLIQPHLEEATIYLFFATIAFVIILVLLGSFVNWLRDRVGFVHNVVSFVDDKMDDVMDFFGLQDENEEEDSRIWSDVHAYKDRRLNARSMPQANQEADREAGTDRCRVAAHMVPLRPQEDGHLLVVEEGVETHEKWCAPGNDKRVFTSRLGDEDMLVFSKVFYVVTPFLCRLDLSYNLLGDEGAKQLASLMGPGPRASALSSLQLRSNDIGPEGAEALCGALRNTRSLRRFDISMNPLGKEGGLLVVSLLQKSPELLELLMGDTKSDIDVLVALAAVLRRHPSQLKVLDVQNPRIFTLQEDHTVHLGKMLRNNTTITELYLGKQRMRDDGARQLVDFLLENKVLRVLDLRCNELGAEAAYSLGTLLAHGSELVSLNLSCNRIGEKDNVEGARAIAEGLTHNSKLQHLDLNHNELCCQALSLLGDSLQKSNLDSLRLFHNHWDQPSSYLFHTILNSRMRRQQLKADFTTSEVDQHIHICKVEVK
ncbi:unnamed protein product [Effrenium voratum]|nr:unnamed protein product [Effrenium voratum]